MATIARKRPRGARADTFGDLSSDRSIISSEKPLPRPS
jgi:hypothetical protein